MTVEPFWKTKKLDEMTSQEWESLCDGCAKCCLVKLEDEDSGELYFTSLHCKLLDGKTCQCKDYPNRKKYVPVCVKLTPEIVATVDWLPQSWHTKTGFGALLIRSILPLRVGGASLGKDSLGGPFLFLDVMLDQFRKHLDLRIVEIVVG